MERKEKGKKKTFNKRKYGMETNSWSYVLYNRYKAHRMYINFLQGTNTKFTVK